MENKETTPEADRSLRALNVDLPADLVRDLKIAAAQQNTTVRAMVEEAIGEWLANCGEPR